MTVSRAERIMQLEVRQVATYPPSPTYKYEAVTMDGYIVAVASDWTQADALSNLVARAYAIRSEQAFREQNYQCFVCGCLRPLQADHIIPRVRGRLDTRANLRAVCATCHQAITDNKLIDPQPHDRVAKAVAKHGWKWGGTGWQRIGT
jgi:tellurite resistance protein